MHSATPVIALAVISLAQAANAGVIRPDAESVEVLPGTQLSMLWLVEDLQTPIIGYSLQLGVSTGAGSTGSVTVDIDASNFHESRNLITAGGGELNPAFSFIQRSGTDGVFLNAISEGDSPFTPTPGMNDVLAEIVWDISADAAGEFLFTLGPASALSDSNGFPVDFDDRSLLITVVPAPATSVCLLGLAVSQCRRRRS